jgi:hypothetical protein
MIVLIVHALCRRWTIHPGNDRDGALSAYGAGA